MSQPDVQVRQIRKRVGRNVFDTPPRISVIIFVHNRAGYIRETLESVLEQKYREHEIIVVNDGSDDTDQLERELKIRFEDITYIRQRHAGEGAARNTGIEHARGDIVAFLNAGDVWQPELLASQYVHLERHALDLVYCDAAIIGTHSVYRRTFTEKYPSSGDMNFESLLDRRCHVLTSGVVARKRVLVMAGGFEFEKVAKPCFHLWLRMLRAGARFGYQSKQLLKLRLYRDDTTSDPLVKLEKERDVFERIGKTFELSDSERSIVERHLAELEAELAAEQGHSFLKSGDYTEALNSFRVANSHQFSLKLTAISWLTRVAPKTALRFADSGRPVDNPYIQPRA